MMNHSMMDHSAHMAMDNSSTGHSMMDHSLMDHSTMDHSTMDHSMMDHSGDNHSAMGHMSTMDHSTMGHGMSMTFHFGVTEKVLFDGWEVKGVSTMLVSCIGIFFIAAIYEGIKYYRENLLWRTYKTLHYRAVDETAITDAENHKTVVREVVCKDPPRMFSQKHLLQTGLHVVQLTVSYLLMLIFMTYNVWLCLAVVIGSAVGYFMFGWKRTVVVDMTETCH